MANIAALLQQLQGNQQIADPLGQLLQSRGAPAAPFSSSIKSQPLPNLVQQQAQAQDQSSDFYSQLNAISDNVTEQRQAAEDMIARNAQKAHDDALLRKIKAMIPQQVSYSGGGGSSYSGGGYSGGPSIALPPGLGSSSSHKSSGGGILPILPDISGGSKGGPSVAGPRCPQHLVDLGMC
jgi:ElaB/YqjD/DUF883 family membrane-anchored ribosome-binding protein